MCMSLSLLNSVSHCPPPLVSVSLSPSFSLGLSFLSFFSPFIFLSCLSLSSCLPVSLSISLFPSSVSLSFCFLWPSLRLCLSLSFSVGLCLCLSLCLSFSSSICLSLYVSQGPPRATLTESAVFISPLYECKSFLTDRPAEDASGETE